MQFLDPPDSAVATRARELCAQVSPPFLINHASRTYAWGSVLAYENDIRFDRELFYVASLLHDLGLTTKFDGPRCFEHESAAAATRFAADQGWPAERRALLEEAIRLHMQARVVVEDGPEAYLLSEATTCDVRGRWLHDIDGAIRRHVLRQYPRLDFKIEFLKMCEDQATRKPGCMRDIFLREGFAEKIREAPFDG
ncbi:MAG: cyanamide hydratase [Actinomycetota bacterium]|nr:cyanamide hydratase [Actinomycetota bacterium]